MPYAAAGLVEVVVLVVVLVFLLLSIAVELCCLTFPSYYIRSKTWRTELQKSKKPFLNIGVTPQSSANER